MKRVLVITAVLVLALGVIGCAQTQAPTPPPDIPRYTADQVIAVAQAQYSGYSSSKGRTSAMVSVSYQGKGRWEVDITVPVGYLLQPGYSRARTLYFDEATGSLFSPPPPPFYPSPTETLSSQQTAEQVISLVVEQAVRKLTSYGGRTPTGNWTAVYEVDR